MAWSSIARFWLAGRGLSFRTGKYIGQALLVGLFAGFVVVAFRGLIRLGDMWIYQWLGQKVLSSGFRIFLPAAGALAAVYIAADDVFGVLDDRFGVVCKYDLCLGALLADH